MENRRKTLQEVVKSGDKERLKKLPKAGASLYLEDLVRYSSDKPYQLTKEELEVAKILIKKCNNLNEGSLDHVIYSAANNNDLPLITVLLGGRADVKLQADHNHPDFLLHLAVRKQNMPLVELLIKAGADPNIISRQYGPADTPLLMAASKSNLAISKLLIEAGADVNKMSYAYGKFTPLYYAVDNNNLPLIKLLIEAGADPYLEMYKEGLENA